MPILRDYRVVNQITVCQLRFRCDGFHDAFEIPEFIPLDDRGTLFQHGLAMLKGWDDRSTFDVSECLCPKCTGRMGPTLAVLEEFRRHSAAKLRETIQDGVQKRKAKRKKT